MTRSTQGHHLRKLGSTRAPDVYTKFQGHWPFGSREENFLRFLPCMGMGAILVMWPWTFEQTFVPPSHESSIWNLTLIGPVVSEEKMFKECGRRTTEAYLSYKLTKWAFGSGELIKTICVWEDAMHFTLMFLKMTSEVKNGHWAIAKGNVFKKNCRWRCGAWDHNYIKDFFLQCIQTGVGLTKCAHDTISKNNWLVYRSMKILQLTIAAIL